jgi:hypothetical protein
MEPFTDYNNLRIGSYYNIDVIEGTIFDKLFPNETCYASNARMVSDNEKYFIFFQEDSTGEESPLAIMKSLNLKFTEIEQPKFTKENAEQILKEISEIIKKRNYCDNDNFMKIFRKVFEPALKEKTVMENIKGGLDGHFRFDIENELLSIDAIISENGRTLRFNKLYDKKDDYGCYFVRKGKDPLLMGSPIPKNYSDRDYTTVNFVIFKNTGIRF